MSDQRHGPRWVIHHRGVFMTDINKTTTNHLLVPVTSMNSGATTRYYAAVVIEVMPSLWEEIEKAELIVQSSDVRIRSVDLRLNITALAGWDYTKDLDATEDQVDAARELLEGLKEARWVTPAELAILQVLEAQDSDGEVLRVYGGDAPILHLYEHDGYEYFESLDIPQLHTAY